MLLILIISMMYCRYCGESLYCPLFDPKYC